MDETTQHITRRDLLVAAAAIGGASVVGGSAIAQDEGDARGARAARMPVVYLPHGGGPWPFVPLGMFPQRDVDSLAGYLRALPSTLPRARALLVISAHWEAPELSVTSAARPPLLYDYYGFPPASYEITWPAPGDPALAANVRALLEGAGFATRADESRGFDHGTFIPLKVAYPAADVPTCSSRCGTGSIRASTWRSGARSRRCATTAC